MGCQQASLARDFWIRCVHVKFELVATEQGGFPGGPWQENRVQVE